MSHITGALKLPVLTVSYPSKPPYVTVQHPNPIESFLHCRYPDTQSATTIRALDVLVCSNDFYMKICPCQVASDMLSLVGGNCSLHLMHYCSGYYIAPLSPICPCIDLATVRTTVFSSTLHVLGRQRSRSGNVWSCDGQLTF